MYYREEELVEIFKGNKKVFDDVYETIKGRYNVEQANVAMYEFFQNHRLDFITRSNNARRNMEKFDYHYEECQHFLIDYAISSFILNNIECHFSLKEINAYARENDENLKYDKNSVIAVVAIGCAENTYWMSNVLSCNRKLRSALIECLITERYVENKKVELDNTKSLKRVKLPDGKEFLVSKSKLNRDVDNMINDDGIPYYKDDENDYSSKHIKE